MEASTAPRTAPLALVRRPARLLRLAGDDRLVAEIRAGSEAAFEVLYDRHHGGVLAFSRQMLGSREEAEDVVQHTFMAAYRDVVGSDKAIQLKPWLYTIARNRCLTLLRARREFPSDRIDEPSLEGLASEVQRRQDLRDLLRDVAALPEAQRAALVLAELGDVSHDEIATVLGCPVQKVKALVFQARSSLAASRSARDTPCDEIREQLANLRGGSLRRTTLRRHVKDCDGCRSFQLEVAHQRRGLALVLPVAPALGLKASVLGGLSGGGGAAAAAGGVAAGGAAGGGVSALIAKGLVVVAVAGGGTAGVSALRDEPAPVTRPADGRPAAEPPGRGGASPAAAIPDGALLGDDPASRSMRPATSGRGGRTEKGARSLATTGTAGPAAAGKLADDDDRPSGEDRTTPRPGAETRARAKSKSKSKSKSKTKAKAKVKAEPRTRTTPRAKQKAAPKTKPKPKPKADSERGAAGPTPSTAPPVPAATAAPPAADVDASPRKPAERDGDEGGVAG